MQLSTAIALLPILTSASGPCHSISPQVSDDWCQTNCNFSPPNCPPSMCDCNPPTPPPPPSPPAPPSPPPSCAGDVVDGWFVAPYAASSSGSAPSSSCMAIYFWGLPPSQWAQFVSSTPDAYTAEKLLPGSYPYKVLNLGGGGTSWGDATIADALNFLPTLKKLGYNGVCFDMEVFPASAASFTMSKMMNLFAQAKQLGLTTVLTSTAEGPYYGCDSPNDCWEDIKWDDIDYMVPQMYGANGANYDSSTFDQYATFWKNGGGQGVHGKFPGPSDLTKVLWSVNPGTGRSHYDQYSYAGGYIEWAYKSLSSADALV